MNEEPKSTVPPLPAKEPEAFVVPKWLIFGAGGLVLAALTAGIWVTELSGSLVRQDHLEGYAKGAIVDDLKRRLESAEEKLETLSGRMLTRSAANDYAVCVKSHIEELQLFSRKFARLSIDQSVIDVRLSVYMIEKPKEIQRYRSIYFTSSLERITYSKQNPSAGMRGIDHIEEHVKSLQAIQEESEKLGSDFNACIEKIQTWDREIKAGNADKI